MGIQILYLTTKLNKMVQRENMTDERVEALYQRAKQMNISGLTDEDAHNAATAFAKIDKDMSDEIDVSELRSALNEAGHKITGHEVRDVLQKWKRDGNSITWDAFVSKFHDLRVA